MTNLAGRVIACLESRYATEMAELVQRHHGIAYPAPCLREVHEPNAAEAQRAVDLLTGKEVDAVVFLTGVGARTIIDGARLANREEQLLSRLAEIEVAARGPKAHNVLRRLGVRVDILAPEPFTSEALLGAIAAGWRLEDKTVMVQLYGAPVPALTQGLAERGARVLTVAPYRWERPLALDAVVRLIEDMAEGWVDVLAATSAAQVEQLFGIARDRGCEADLRRALAGAKPLIAAQGVVCATAFEREGVRVDIIPAHTSMGALVLEIARSGGTRRPAEPAPRLDGNVAILATRDLAGLRDLTPAFSEIAASASVTLLAGSGRKSERALERAAHARGIATRTVSPNTQARHPADELVRSADSVLIVSRDGRAARPLRRLAERYAKPIREVQLSPAPRTVLGKMDPSPVASR